MHDNDPKVCSFSLVYHSLFLTFDPFQLLEEEKLKNLAGKQHKASSPHDHAPGWNEYLASASEATVKADKSDGDPETLQKKTIEHVKARHHSEDQTVGVEASYERDEIEGPLKGSGKVPRTPSEEDVSLFLRVIQDIECSLTKRDREDSG